MQILVTGGAGYIGSVTVEKLIEAGYDVVVVDNLSTGRRDAVADSIPFYECNCGERREIKKVFADHEIDVVMHFAASVQVGESVEEPAMYFQNNITETLNLLESMRKSGCNKFILSSTAATFGEPEYTPIDESHPQNPVNPYGLTKLINEQTLEWYHRAYGFKYHVFRYFNASGATEKHGELREIETHIIPLLLAAVMENKDFALFGNDYSTPDGTCIRDYVHVSDLAQAHILGIDNLDKIPNASYNLGNGNGFSNLEVIEAVKQVTGVDVKFSIGPRRDGDPAVLLASSEKAKKELGWQPHYTKLTKIVESAYKFYMKISP